jgi:hypothetical protein
MKKKPLALSIIALVATVAVFAGTRYGGWFRKDSGLQGSGTIKRAIFVSAPKSAVASTNSWCKKATR